MASGSLSHGTEWSERQNKYFEQLLALYDENTPDRWQKVARDVGRSVEEVKRHYERLEKDVRHIESGDVSFPYSQSSRRSRG